MITQACKVQFSGVDVGTLAITEDSPWVSFEYDAAWVAEGFSLSPLHMPLTKAPQNFPSLSFETYRGLPSVFADSLPDDFGNALINSWLARQGLDKSQFGALDRLLYTGTRGMGALEYQNAIQLPENNGDTLQLPALVELAQKVLNDRNHVDITANEQNAMSHLLQVGTSAGGARPKAVIAVNKDRTQILSGQVDTPAGFEHYLLKFDGVTEHNTNTETFGDPKGFGLMEYSYSLMATGCGINMSPCEILAENGRSHFMTRRFDREENQKYHVLTLCGMDHADFKKPGYYSYEELLAVARKLALSNKEQEQIFRRMVFNVIARNHDDHTKNTAFLVDDDFRWVLAPAYDIAYSYKPGSPWVDKHQMTIAGKRDNFTREDLLSVGQLIGSLTPRKSNKIIDGIINEVRRWPEIAEENHVFPTLRDEITQNLVLDI
ncbi:type II toxin-antitoxin system HipA family toxin [Cedecea sp. FDAARGOS_727]|uniref:type II toxin-antitoxin system HipA family toxin n=1 Tax=Cedecea sp. FDAARGOS_727 TaxID=2545798 RepID=UPI00143E6FC7|nr:type II toxin-antitoxin system HipA family toxin [Cedecea sp. FDAARGOS_727]QIX96386.1 type II toxin-antitoxin system HipA family toxin [Cedecea sp. FDAARGOS_727]